MSENTEKAREFEQWFAKKGVKDGLGRLWRLEEMARSAWDAALATSRAEGPETPEWDGGWSQRTPEERAEIEKLWQVEQDHPPLIGNRARARQSAASQPSAEHAPAGPLRRMREAVECVRHEGNDLGECWMDCRRCRLEKELAALAATNAQPATSRAEGPASDALNALVAEKRQLIMDVINTARNGKWNNLVDNAADYALNGFESAVRESAVRDAAFTSQPSAEHAPEVVALSQMKDEEIDTSDIPEVTNWSKAEKGKFYRAATPAQLRSALEQEIEDTLRFALRESGCDGDLCMHEWHERARRILNEVDEQRAASPTSAEHAPAPQPDDESPFSLRESFDDWKSQIELRRNSRDLFQQGVKRGLEMAVGDVEPLLAAAQPAPARPDEQCNCEEWGCTGNCPVHSFWARTKSMAAGTLPLPTPARPVELECGCVTNGDEECKHDEQE